MAVGRIVSGLIIIRTQSVPRANARLVAAVVKRAVLRLRMELYSTNSEIADKFVARDR